MLKRLGAIAAVAASLALAACAPPAVAPTSGNNTSDTINGYGCGQALAYLRAHAAPGYVAYCPHSANWVGTQGRADASQHNAAITCRNFPPVCPAGSKVIYIEVPCEAAYLNEAYNSTLFAADPNRVIPMSELDPFGACRAAGNPFGWVPPDAPSP